MEWDQQYVPAPPPPPPPPPVGEGEFDWMDSPVAGERQTGVGALEVSQATDVYDIMRHCFRFEISKRTFNLTFEAIKNNPENEHVWKSRRILLDKLGIDLQTELGSMGSLAKSNAIVNAQSFWCHRLLIVQKLGRKAEKKECGFIRKFLLQHPDNDGAWFNLEALTGTSVAAIREGLDFAERLISIHKNNRRVWDYRFYLFLGVETYDWKSELNFIEHRLCKGSNDELVWKYRQDLVRQIGAFLEEFAFTKRMLNRNAGDYRAWSYRWWIVKHHKFPQEIIGQELELSKKYIYPNACNLYAWSYRHLVIEKLSCSHMEEELELTHNILTADARNIYAWFHRQWVLQSFDKWKDEIEFCDKLLGMDINNGFAWTQRFIARKASSTHFGDYITKEYIYAACAICDNPEDEGSWMYLKSFYRKGGFDDIILEEICRHVLPCKIHDIEEYGGEIVMNKMIFVNAFGTILDLFVRGYYPSSNMVAMLSLSQLEEEFERVEITPDWFVWRICLVLAFVDPINKVYWYHRGRMLLKKIYDEDLHWL